MTGLEVGGRSVIKSSVNRLKESLQIKIEIPIGELLAHLGPRQDQFRSRLRQYFEHLERDVFEIAEVLSKEEELGTVKWFNDSLGYGFVTSIENEDIFVHWRGITGDGFKSLKKGQKVRFKRRQGKETFEAIDVLPVDGTGTLE